MDVSSSCLALLLLAGAGPEGAGVAPTVADSAPAPPPAAQIALADLELRTVRVRTAAGTYVLHRPRFVEGGVAWYRVDGYPRGPRPLLAPDWGTAPPPPNPVPWSRVERLERKVSGRGRGTVVGATIGAVLGGTGGGFLGWAAALGEGGSLGGVGATIAIGAVAGGVILGVLGRTLWDPPDRWEEIEVAGVGDAGTGGTSR